ncbi:MAG: EscU/YscU/HrcU family type III secretion system export apparatus switch protein [Bdellovibrionales bacterium]|nr:EscU/YscU/HrcU family type III secretion system export apparatus switch protein [Bdellovibrionales bacterium]
MKNRERSQEDRAVALKYRSSEELPVVLKNERGVLARKVLDYAEANGIPIQQDGGLVALLDQVPVESAIPPKSFAIIAELLCFLYETDSKFRDEHPYMSKLAS